MPLPFSWSSFHFWKVSGVLFCFSKLCSSTHLTSWLPEYWAHPLQRVLSGSLQFDQQDKLWMWMIDAWCMKFCAFLDRFTEIHIQGLVLWVKILQEKLCLNPCWELYVGTVVSTLAMFSSPLYHRSLIEAHKCIKCHQFLASTSSFLSNHPI